MYELGAEDVDRTCGAGKRALVRSHAGLATNLRLTELQLKIVERLQVPASIPVVCRSCRLRRESGEDGWLGVFCRLCGIRNGSNCFKIQRVAGNNLDNLEI